MFPSTCQRPERHVQNRRQLRRLPRHTCRGCKAHPARFRYRGEVRADRDHELCFRCFRALIDQLRAKALGEAA